MYDVESTGLFAKNAFKIAKHDKKLQLQIDKTVKQLSLNPFSKGLRTHKANIKNFGKRYSSRVTKDIRIVWDFKGKTIILLITIGGHSGADKVYT